jgi:hypothetical protein
MLWGADPITAFKLVLAMSFPFGAFFTYLWLKRHFGSWPSFLGGLIYAYLPYHLANVYVRGALGETVAATILPLSFWAIDKTAEKSRKSIAIAALIITLVILAHPFYGLVFGVIWIGYAGFDIKRVTAIAWGYLNAAFYILPAIFYKHLTFLDRIENYFLEKNGFVTIKQLIFSPWSYEGIGSTGQVNMSVQLGAGVLIIFLGWLGIWFFKRKRYVKETAYKLSVYFLAVFLVGIFMMTPSSLPFWKILTPLRAVQFPWRLLFVATTAAVFCGTFFLSKLMTSNKRKVLILLAGWVVLVLTTLDYARVKQYLPWEDPAQDSLGYRGTYTLLLEETPIWHSPFDEFNQLHKYEASKTEKGDFKVNSLVWKTNYHKLEVETPQGGILSNKTHYWPGWKAYVDGKEVRLLDPENPYSHGLLTMEIPAGKHIVETRLTEPPLNRLANLISLISLILVLASIMYPVVRLKYQCLKK